MSWYSFMNIVGDALGAIVFQPHNESDLRKILKDSVPGLKNEVQGPDSEG